jgi:hypothetical protein
LIHTSSPQKPCFKPGIHLPLSGKPSLHLLGKTEFALAK